MIQVYNQKLTTLRVHTSLNKGKIYPLGSWYVTVCPCTETIKHERKQPNLVRGTIVDALVAGISSRFSSQLEDLETASSVGISPEVQVVLVQRR